MPTILRLPKERKLWILRKHVYGGIPPTDPRILAMTDEQIELELAHAQLDRKMRDSNGKEFEDEEFDQFDRETEEEDSKLSETLMFGHSSEVRVQSESNSDPDEWEDVETDDLDSDLILD